MASPSFSVVRPKRQELTLYEKVQVIYASPGKSQRQLARQFNIGKSQAATIVKRKAEILHEYEKAPNATRKRLKASNFTPTHKAVDEGVFEWFLRMREDSKAIPISGPMIQSKALEIAKAMGDDSFRASGGWLSRFKERHLISGVRVSGERTLTIRESPAPLLPFIRDALSSNSPNHDTTDPPSASRSPLPEQHSPLSSSDVKVDDGEDGQDDTDDYGDDGDDKHKDTDKDSQDPVVPETTDADVFWMLQKARDHLLRRGLTEPTSFVMMAIDSFALVKAHEIQLLSNPPSAPR